MKNLKIFFLIPAALLLLPGLHAQEVHSMRATVGGGMHSQLFRNEAFRNVMGGGLRVDVEYAYYFHTNVGVQTGLGFDWLNSRVKGDFTYSYDDIDRYNNNMPRTITADFKNLNEHQTAYSITIPVAVRGRFYIAKGWTALPSLGLAARFICGGRQKAEQGSVSISGYYKDWNLNIDPDVPLHGFSVYDIQCNEKLRYRPANLDVIVDCMFDYQIDNLIGVSFGPYFSISTINSLRSSDKPLIQIQDGGLDPIYNGVFTSNLVNSTRPISVGIRVGVSFRLTDERYSRYNPWD